MAIRSVNPYIERCKRVGKPDEPALGPEPKPPHAGATDQGWIRPKHGPSSAPRRPVGAVEAEEWLEEHAGSRGGTRRPGTLGNGPVGEPDGPDQRRPQSERLKPPHPPYPTRGWVRADDVQEGVYGCYLENDRENDQIEMHGTLARVLDWALHEQHAEEIHLWNKADGVYDFLTRDQAQQLRLTEPGT